MDKQYRKLKRISMSAIILFVILLMTMMVHITMEYIRLSSAFESSTPAPTAFLLGLFYIPFLVILFVVYLKFRKKMKASYSDKFRKELTKKVIINRSIKVIVISAITCLILLIVAPFIVISIMVNRHANYLGYATENQPMQDIYQATDFGLNENQRYLTTEDGLKIWTSEIFTEQPKAVIIYLSGIYQPSVTYFYGHARFMRKNGYASFLLEVRGHGKSEGNKICLGYEEVNDVKAVIEYIRSKKEYDGVPIVLHGVSMGGAAAVNAFGQINEVDGLIAMSAYSSFEDEVIDQMGSYKIPKIIRVLERPLIHMALTLQFGNDTVNIIKPEEQISNANHRPVLLIACTGDTEVPMGNTERLHKANPEAETWLRDSWEHFIVENCDFINMEQDEEYCNRILRFLENKVLKQ